MSFTYTPCNSSVIINLENVSENLVLFNQRYFAGLIHEGDELREVNGVQMEDKTPEEIIPIMVWVCVCVVCFKSVSLAKWG